MSSAETLPKPLVSDQAVEAMTGKSWSDWFAILDAAGAAAKPHREIAAMLHTSFNVDGWWAQTITVSYERARGLRKVHQVEKGYQISVSKTLPLGVDDLWRYFDETLLRRKWLKGRITFRTRTLHRSMRADWGEAKANLEFVFTPKGEKCQVTVQESKLADEAAAEGAKQFWREALAQLAKQVGGSPR